MITLQVQQLSKRYIKKPVLSDLSFTHESGVLGIAGENGSGKSTLLKCLSYLLKPSKGNFSWIKDGKVLDRTEVKSITGFAAPYISLYAELTARENIQFISNISDLEISEDHISSLIDEMDVASFQHQAFGSLSSGQKQRVKLAVALVQQPEILILDEPGTNLDEKGFSLIEKLVNDSKSQNRFMVIASNNKLELDLCDQIINLTNS